MKSKNTGLKWSCANQQHLLSQSHFYIIFSTISSSIWVHGTYKILKSSSTAWWSIQKRSSRRDMPAKHVSVAQKLAISAMCQCDDERNLGYSDICGWINSVEESPGHRAFLLSLSLSQFRIRRWLLNTNSVTQTLSNHNSITLSFAGLF